jgi:hypothetical protein
VITTRHISCYSCGGSLWPDNICAYCGNKNIVCDDGLTLSVGSGIRTKGVFNIEVKKDVRGKISIVADSQYIGAKIKLIRVQLGKPDAIKSFKYRNTEFVLGFNSYSHQASISDILSHGEIIDNIDEFNFNGLKKGTAINLTLFSEAFGEA